MAYDLKYPIDVESCKSILIVEDTREIMDVIKTLLDMEGYISFQAVDGKEAIEKLKILAKASHPCLVLCDLMMPHDGFNVLQALEHTDTLVSIPIVMMTASTQITDGYKGKRVLKKPFSMDGILDIVHQYCGPSPKSKGVETKIAIPKQS